MHKTLAMRRDVHNLWSMEMASPFDFQGIRIKRSVSYKGQQEPGCPINSFTV